MLPVSPDTAIGLDVVAASVHEVPPSVEMSYPVTVPVGAVNATEKLEDVELLTLNDDGAASTVVPEKFEVAVPVPPALTSRICSCE